MKKPTDATDADRLLFLVHARELAENYIKHHGRYGRIGVRSVYYDLRDDPRSIVEPDRGQDGVYWGKWVKNRLIIARKRWLAGHRDEWAIDPDLFEEEGREIVSSDFYESIDEWIDEWQPFYGDPWEGQPKRVIVITEKDGSKGILEAARQKLWFSYASSKGDGTIKQRQRIQKKILGWETEGHDVQFLYLGDHDPQGVRMDAKWIEEIDVVTTVERIGITLEQAHERGLPTESVRDKRKNLKGLTGKKLAAAKGHNTKLDAYVEQHGDEAIELNALMREPEELEALILEAVKRHIDADIWSDCQAEQEQIHRKTGKALERLKRELRELLK
jgi:hypothetical protein